MLCKDNHRDTIYSHFAASILTVILLFPLTFMDPPLATKNHESRENSWMEIQWKTKINKDKLYAEANPSIPENFPDETNLLSTQNQQAAQPKIDPKKKEDVTPGLLGDSNNPKIVERKFDHANQKEAPDLMHKGVQDTPSTVSQPTPVKATDEQVFPKGKGIELPSFETLSNQKIINLSPTPQKKQEAPYISDTQTQVRNQQKVRPKLSQDVLSGPLLRSTSQAPRIGKVAIECRLNPYGVYMQQMLRSIENQWGELIRSSFRYMKQDQILPSVTYTFTLIKDGTIQGLSKTSTGDTGSLSSELCRQAIASRVPFGNWEDEMIAEFGNSDQITITFSYH